MKYLDLITEIRKLIADDIPTHPSALLSTRQLAQLAGIGYTTLLRKLPKWQANGLKVAYEIYGGELRPRGVKLSDWNKFLEKVAKEEIPI